MFRGGGRVLARAVYRHPPSPAVEGPPTPALLPKQVSSLGEGDKASMWELLQRGPQSTPVARHVAVQTDGDLDSLTSSSRSLYTQYRATKVPFKDGEPEPETSVTAEPGKEEKPAEQEEVCEKVCCLPPPPPPNQHHGLVPTPPPLPLAPPPPVLAGVGGLHRLEFLQFKFCPKILCAICSVFLRICAGVR